LSRKRRRGPGPPPPEKTELHDDRSPDVHLLLAIAACVSGDPKVAVSAARRAFLENLYLPALLRGERPPKLGLVHGIAEAGPEHARALVESVKPILGSAPEAAKFLRAIAEAPTVKEERESFATLARTLLEEADQDRRRRIQGEIEVLRDPKRLADTSAAVMAEAGIVQTEPPPCDPDEFEV
jgi:hypothetical protein